MPKITVNDLTGNSTDVEMSEGLSLMEGLRNAGFDDVLALCGGALSCATCHVHVDAKSLEKLPPQSQDEKDLLELSESLSEQSRLSCQISLTQELNEMVVSLVNPE